MVGFNFIQLLHLSFSDIHTVLCLGFFPLVFMMLLYMGKDLDPTISLISEKFSIGLLFIQHYLLGAYYVF